MYPSYVVVFPHCYVAYRAHHRRVYYNFNSTLFCIYKSIEKYMLPLYLRISILASPHPFIKPQKVSNFVSATRIRTTPASSSRMSVKARVAYWMNSNGHEPMFMGSIGKVITCTVLNFKTTVIIIFSFFPSTRDHRRNILKCSAPASENSYMYGRTAHSASAIPSSFSLFLSKSSTCSWGRPHPLPLL